MKLFAYRQDYKFQFNGAVKAILTRRRTSVNWRLTDERTELMSDAQTEDSHPAASPGQAVRAAMERLGWSQSDLGYVLGVTTATVNQIIGGKRGISPAMAKALGLALGMETQTLVAMQAEWELRQADEPAPIVDARARLLSRYPLREMVRRGWLPDTGDPAELEDKACRFFGISALNESPKITHAARRAKPGDISGAQLAWLFRVRQIAKTMRAEPYTTARLKHAMDRLSEARGEPEGVRHVPRLMREAGVRFVVVEALPSSEIDGVCLWLDDSSPAIAVSMRFDRIDNFWFVLAHECTHALSGHGKDGSFIIDADLTSTIGR
jgi:HTH-type transcriptional regulator / antitoxin HigA